LNRNRLPRNGAAKCKFSKAVSPKKSTNDVQMESVTVPSTDPKVATTATHATKIIDWFVARPAPNKEKATKRPAKRTWCDISSESESGDGYGSEYEEVMAEKAARRKKWL